MERNRSQMSPSRRRSAWLAVLLVASVTSCLGNPTTPPANGLLFQGGVYVLSFSGSDAVYNGAGAFVPACPGITSAGIHPVTARIELSLDGETWRGRPLTAADGAFTIAFVAGPVGSGAPGGGPGIVGTGSGVLANTVPLSPTSPVSGDRVGFSGGTSGTTASFSGGMSRFGDIAGGTISGDVTFTSSTGASTSCVSGTATWFLSKAGG
jgi:hypothetical protein